MQFVQGLLALHPWWVDVRFEFAHKKWQCQFTRFLISWAALDNYKKIRKRLFIKQSLKQQKSKNLFPSSQIPNTQILNSLFPLTFRATKQKNKKIKYKDLLPNPIPKSKHHKSKTQTESQIHNHNYTFCLTILTCNDLRSSRISLRPLSQYSHATIWEARRYLRACTLESPCPRLPWHHQSF